MTMDQFFFLFLNVDYHVPTLNYLIILVFHVKISIKTIIPS